MTCRPWLACTTSGTFLLPETASLSVVLRSSNDFATRLMVMFGYLAWKASLSALICLAWPPRTSWSQTVSVTSPALETSTAFELSRALSAFSALSPLLPPGEAPQPASSTASAAHEIAAQRGLPTLDIPQLLL